MRPEEVMGESRPGRKLVFTGDTEPCDATVAVAHGAELLVHDGTFADEEIERAPPDRATRPRARRRRWRATPTSRCSRSRICRRATSPR